MTQGNSRQGGAIDRVEAGSGSSLIANVPAVGCETIHETMHTIFHLDNCLISAGYGNNENFTR
ncbi:hypothetical protein [Geotalea uraniireducens]|uniref:hypothetical protein n=1 Tax=Geotalea uraniireducens TaxID=351604 RepID=UPI0024917ED5|nr:hypothetical protein [Geotalea uraniireducens]